MKDSLVGRLEAIGSPKILVLGDLALDRYVWGETCRISAEAPIPVLRRERDEERPGCAGNVVSVLHELGVEVACCGVVGDDSEGEALTRRLSELCGGAPFIVVDKQRPTSLKTRFIGYVQSAGRAMHQILRVDNEHTDPIGGAVEDEVGASLRRAIPEHDLVVISDYEKGLLTRGVMRAALRAAEEAGVPVIADPKLGREPAFYEGVHLITPNRFETRALTGIALERKEDMREAAEKLVPSVARQAVLITLDRDGMYLYEAGGGERLIRSQPREVYDVSGAGDVVVGVMALALAAGVPCAEAAEMANVAAEIEVGKLGAVPVSRQEIAEGLMWREGMPPSKVRPETELLEILAERRRRNETVVFTNGCFDILHMGHIEMLKFARKQGDLLVVGMNSDSSVRQLKGPTRPILGQRERSYILGALEDVDYIVIFEDLSVHRLIEAVRPEVLVKGGDYGPEGVVGGSFVESYGGRVVLAPVVENVSTTSIVSRILEIHNDRNNESEGGP